MICFRIAAENKFDRSVHRAITFANVSFKTVKINPRWKYFLGKADNLSWYCLVIDTGTHSVGAWCVCPCKEIAASGPHADSCVLRQSCRGRGCPISDRCDRSLCTFTDACSRAGWSVPHALSTGALSDRLGATKWERRHGASVISAWRSDRSHPAALSELCLAWYFKSR